jgi:hypothetical protein
MLRMMPVGAADGAKGYGIEQTFRFGNLDRLAGVVTMQPSNPS